MTGKLMKYELRSMLRTFLPLWGAILVVALLNRCTLQIESLRDWLGGVPAILMMVLYVIAIIAIAIVALVFMIQRFYNGMLKDEGYLMFTLPVKTSQLIWAKCLSATILTFATSLVCFASVMILVVNNDLIRQLQELFSDITTVFYFNELEIPAGFIPQVFLMMLVLGVASITASILHAYLAMAIGQLAGKHKAGISILAYILISMALSTISTSFMASNGFGLGNLLENVHWLEDVSLTGGLWMFFGFSLLVTVLQIVIFYFPTNALLKNKLNLE